MALTAAYLAILGALAVYGLHRAHLVWLFVRHGGRAPEPPRRFSEAERPVVTVQLPIFNEANVVERLLDAVARIRWPAGRLEVQVLDDSTDETRELAERKCAELAAAGLAIVHLHRTDRAGYKAGALQAGLSVARGEFVMVFDADFLPGPDILERTMDHFTDPRVGVVQARWQHVNQGYSLLTETQALILDGHFVVEQGARCRSGRFFNFNGTAGIWRRSAIVDAGGWSADTLTEDLDLSYRAQLKGWRLVYLPDVAAPAELPVEMASFKSQQFRWAKGALQVARKLLPAVLRAPVPLRVKIEAFLHLTHNVAYPLTALLAVLLLPSLLVRGPGATGRMLALELPLFVVTTLSIASFYAVSGGARRAFLRLPFLMAMGIGLSLNQARAVIEGLAGRPSEFVRTPKTGVISRRDRSRRRYRTARTLVPLLEVALAAYFLAAAVIAWRQGHALALPFLLLFFSGFAWVGGKSLFEAGSRS